ncbi:signal peptidase I [Saccharococcus caldoxylosilyticus]|jgi:signal peptidase I|uniref:signal peptidase I n=1 Tax=Saccharococcus caldoxylosilyticus TaxID=81408 RepID=UPI001C7602CA|nr:Signal peptidase I V [Parageobacillus caldoxylosilyticus]BDG34716.1 signal peptidase I [Parageobacillus caldoxylosilyticus]BDG38490.1 signal peptidase I [Parageobacillus caldoxylosilyticus]BDG42277.1 signal peptidase I [Parageobacillus caldoxylosilyticus]
MTGDGKMKKNERWWRRLALFAGVLAVIFIRLFCFTNYMVEGKSMMPTLQEGNLLIVNKLSYHIGHIQRFDVIVFHANKKEDYVKRVIGLPGDQIAYKNDVLYINGRKVNEPYLQPYKQKLIDGKLTGDFTLEELTGKKRVPEGYIFVLGDNRLSSWDSRHFGFVKISQVVGKVDLRYWPVRQFAVQF